MTEMAFANKRIVVTGAGGFVAASVIARLAGEPCRVIAVERPGVEFPVPASKAVFERAEGDIADKEFWRRMLQGANFVFHFAAQTSVYQAAMDPPADWQANVAPMLALLEACRSDGPRPLVLFAGSCTQYGLPERLPVDETQRDGPVTIYDRHKIAAEGYLAHYAEQGWARGTTLRLANVYGPGPVSSKPDRGILNLMMRRALKGEDLTMYGDGVFVRDYVFVGDVAEAFLAAARCADQVNGRHFIVAGGQGTSLATAFALVAERAALLTGRKVAVVSTPPPKGLSPIEDRNFVADISALRKATGWMPRTGLAEGIDITLKSMLGGSA